MDDIKVSELPAVTVVDGAEEHLVNQAGTSKKQTTDQTKEYILNGVLPAVTLVSGAEEHIVRQGGVPKKQTTDQTKAYTLNGGQTTTITVVTNLNKSGYILQKKERTLTLTNGIITDIGTESAWIDVGDFSSPY